MPLIMPVIIAFAFNVESRTLCKHVYTGKPIKDLHGNQCIWRSGVTELIKGLGGSCGSPPTNMCWAARLLCLQMPACLQYIPCCNHVIFAVSTNNFTTSTMSSVLNYMTKGVVRAAPPIYVELPGCFAFPQMHSVSLIFPIFFWRFLSRPRVDLMSLMEAAGPPPI